MGPLSGIVELLRVPFRKLQRVPFSSLPDQLPDPFRELLRVSFRNYFLWRTSHRTRHLKIPLVRSCSYSEFFWSKVWMGKFKLHMMPINCRAPNRVRNLA